MKLESVYKHELAVSYLYHLLTERDPSINISHKKMPSFREHERFFNSKPYRFWYLIEVDGSAVGACYLTKKNEVGIAVSSQHRGKGYGLEAVNLLTQRHKPLKAIPSKRSGQFIANINPANERSIRLFRKLGFVHIQNTYRL